MSSAASMSIIMMTTTTTAAVDPRLVGMSLRGKALPLLEGGAGQVGCHTASRQGTGCKVRGRGG
jgi:hypothetical protein